MWLTTLGRTLIMDGTLQEMAFQLGALMRQVCTQGKDDKDAL